LSLWPAEFLNGDGDVGGSFFFFTRDSNPGLQDERWVCWPLIHCPPVCLCCFFPCKCSVLSHFPYKSLQDSSSSYLSFSPLIFKEFCWKMHNPPQASIRRWHYGCEDNSGHITNKREDGHIGEWRVILIPNLEKNP